MAAPTNPCKIGEYVCDGVMLYQCVGTAESGPTVPPPSSTMPEAVLLSMAQSLGAILSELYVIRGEVQELKHSKQMVSLTTDFDKSTGGLHVYFLQQQSWYFEGFTIHLNAAPTTTSEMLTLKLHNKKGIDQSVVLYEIDPLAAGETDYYFLVPNGPLRLEGGDAIDIDWNNTDAKTWGLRVIAHTYLRD